MTVMAIRFNSLRVCVLACALMLAALPASASPYVWNCNWAPGVRYPVFDWRSANDGMLPQTHTLRMLEDTLEMRIEEGTRENVAADEILVILESAGPWMWKKEIAAHYTSGMPWFNRTVSSVITDVSNPGPRSMRFRRAQCSLTQIEGASTLVFRKIDALGWLMRDMYHFDLDPFWTTLAGKIVTFRWLDDNNGDPLYPPDYLSPSAIPFDRDLAAVAVAGSFDRIDLFDTRRDSLYHAWLDGGLWTEESWASRFVPWLGYIPYTSKPAVSSRGFGEIDAFVRDGQTETLWHHWDGLSWTFNRVTSPGCSLGGVTSAPASVSWASNRIDLVARGHDFSLWHRWYDGYQWSCWHSLGGFLTSSPAIVSRGPNRLDIFVRGGDNALWTISWTGSEWSNWSSLGGVITSDPAAVVYGPERVAVFARGRNNALWVKVNNGAGATVDDWQSGWYEWGSLGGVIASGPAAASTHDDHIDVFVRGTDNEVYKTSWQSPTSHGYGGQPATSNSSGWRDWSLVPLPICGGPC